MPPKLYNVVVYTSHIERFTLPNGLITEHIYDMSQTRVGVSLTKRDAKKVFKANSAHLNGKHGKTSLGGTARWQYRFNRGHVWSHGVVMNPVEATNAR